MQFLTFVPGAKELFSINQLFSWRIEKIESRVKMIFNPLPKKNNQNSKIKTIFISLQTPQIH